MKISAKQGQINTIGQHLQVEKASTVVQKPHCRGSCLLASVFKPSFYCPWAKAFSPRMLPCQTKIKVTGCSLGS